jgi:hypothetical protein
MFVIYNAYRIITVPEPPLPPFLPPPIDGIYEPPPPPPPVFATLHVIKLVDIIK